MIQATESVAPNSGYDPKTAQTSLTITQSP